MAVRIFVTAQLVLGAVLSFVMLGVWIHRVDGGNLVAWMAFLISAATFAWKFVETYIRYPRIGVVMRGHIKIRVSGIASVAIVGGGEPAPAPPEPPTPSRERPEETFDVIVVNRGAEAISIAGVGLRAEDKSVAAVSVEKLRDGGREIVGPDLPARIEGHGAFKWTIPPDIMNQFPRGTKLIGYADRYRAFRKYPKWDRNPFKRYETPIQYTKN